MLLPRDLFPRVFRRRGSFPSPLARSALIFRYTGDCFASSCGEEPRMSASTTTYRDQALAELEAVPDEYLPFLIQLIRSFHESVRLKPARDSFRQGWREARRGETYPITSLWDDLDAE